MLIVRKLIVDEYNELFDAQGMKYIEYPGDYSKVRFYAEDVLKECPKAYLSDKLLEQQLSELIKNGIKHGNHRDPGKKIKIWYDFRNRARFIVEDEGEGFKDLNNWNDFYRKRQTALFENDFDTFLELANYVGPNSDDDDGGNSLIAALEYWNGGMIYNNSKNKIGVQRWFQSGSTKE